MTTTARTRSRRPGQTLPGGTLPGPRRPGQPQEETRRVAVPRQAPRPPAAAPAAPDITPASAPERRAGPVTAARRPAGADARHSSRTPFVLLVVGLLGGGLASLLVVNTTMAAGSFQINKLQQQNTATAQQIAQLQQRVATEQAPGTIQQRAQQLGMRPQPVLNFVDLRTGRHYSTAGPVPPQYTAPGYTP